MRLIDADALEKQGWTMHRTVAVDPQTMEMQMKKPTDFPTIDAVPVVCCRDCKHYKYPYCDKHFDAYVRMDNWFCADGERR